MNINTKTNIKITVSILLFFTLLNYIMMTEGTIQNQRSEIGYGVLISSELQNDGTVVLKMLLEHGKVYTDPEYPPRYYTFQTNITLANNLEYNTLYHLKLRRIDTRWHLPELELLAAKPSGQSTLWLGHMNDLEPFD
jgi:hypothetical protein